ncbi:hypothetical protein [Nitratiruptor tergarcus]|uniref:hypothetical protein n=1 Tax=Nitratiruptor tergarcus TaxID=269259 RepID=UPI000A022ED3|nr:hypothetical protein [Nitratiruptor tergarcus]
MGYFRFTQVSISIGSLEKKSKHSTLEAFKNLGYSELIYERLKLLQIINNDLNSIDIEYMDKIRMELEDLGKE